ncbi:MAG: hypothetical protein OJF62_002152 [Pseudolabrys sp.]|nr:hypothetical protein [Pseudolabrys sp.]
MLLTWLRTLGFMAVSESARAHGRGHAKRLLENSLEFGTAVPGLRRRGQRHQGIKQA